MFLPAKYRKQPYVVHRCSCIYTAILVLKKLKKQKTKQDILEAGVGKSLWFKDSIVCLLSKFKTSIVYTISSRSAWPIY